MSRKSRAADRLEGRRRGTAVAVEEEEEVAAFQIISLAFLFSVGQQEDVHQGDVVISGCAHFLLATPRKSPALSGRRGQGNEASPH